MSNKAAGVSHSKPLCLGVSTNLQPNCLQTTGTNYISHRWVQTPEDSIKSSPRQAGMLCSYQRDHRDRSPVSEERKENTSLINEHEIQRKWKMWDKKNEAHTFRLNPGVKRNSE